MHRARPTGQGVLVGVLEWRDVLLEGATYDGDTRWPVGFNPQEHGALRVE
ncbi:MAG TPA: hypothetical protein VNJ09_01225 [Chthonomonadales bacterium]|nr:hypothetical protein [Chthonomonadales bacterium]